MDFVAVTSKRHEDEVLQLPAIFRIHLRGGGVDEPRIDHVVLVGVDPSHGERIGHDRDGIDEIGVLQPIKIVGHALAVRRYG